MAVFTTLNDLKLMSMRHQEDKIGYKDVRI